MPKQRKASPRFARNGQQFVIAILIAIWESYRYELPLKKGALQELMTAHMKYLKSSNNQFSELHMELQARSGLPADEFSPRAYLLAIAVMYFRPDTGFEKSYLY